MNDSQMSQSREELIEYLDTHCIDSFGELQTCQVADFIIDERKRVVEPLVKLREFEYADVDTMSQQAIYETIKNAGVEQ